MKSFVLTWLSLTSIIITVVEGVDFIPVGCYRDKHTPNARPLPELVANYRDTGLDWHDLYSSVVERCAKAAMDKGYQYFGVQFYGECWSGPNGDKTFDIDGESDNCSSDVGKDFALMVYKKVTTETECVDYKTLNEQDRAFSSPGGSRCDFSLESSPSTWYRFTGQAGTAMAHSCTYKERCGTLLTGWLKGTPPSVQEGIVTRKVCFSSRTTSNTGHCCDDYDNIRIRNCGRFYVYNQLKAAIPGCPMRYCGNHGA